MLDSATAILDSDTLLSSLRFTQKHSHSTLTLTETSSIWLIWWWQPSLILPSWIKPFCTKLWLKTNSIWLKLIQSYLTWWCQPSWNLPSWIQLFEPKKTSLIHSVPTLWWQPSWILPSWIQQFCTKLCAQTSSFSLNLMMWDILNSAILDSAILAQQHFHSYILTHLDDCSHLEYCHLGFSNFAQNSVSN